MTIAPLALIAVLTAMTLSGCAGNAPQSDQARADAATNAACRQRANEVFDRQNRGTIYSANSSANSPFSANFTPGVTSRGLSDQFAHDRMVSDCVRNSGTGADRSQPAPTQPAPTQP
jgi:PBP1b-binding outer membrane lipoprotein LpoB